MNNRLHLIIAFLLFISAFHTLSITASSETISRGFPEFANIPDRFFDEDSAGGTGLVDLAYHFQDNGTKTIVYEIILESDPAHIDGVISDDKMDFVQVVPDWSGSANFQASGTDIGPDGIPDTGDDEVVVSNVFKVSVIPTNDPPVITSVDGTAVVEDEVVQITLTEGILHELNIDINEPDKDEVSISTNFTLANFEVVQTSDGGPLLRFTPSSWDIGKISMELTVTDSNDTNDIALMEITVENANDGPNAIIDAPQEGLVVAEGVPVIFDGSRSSDRDLPHGDALTYLWESNISGVLSNVDNFEVSLETGAHQIQLTVQDNGKASAYATVNITVLPKTTLKISRWAPEPYFMILPQDSYYNNFQLWVNQSSSGLWPSYEWYLDGVKVAEDGPADSTEYELALQDLNLTSLHDLTVIASIYGVHTSHSWTLAVEKTIENKAPSLKPLQRVVAPIEVGDNLTLEVEASDPDGDALRYVWIGTGVSRQTEIGSEFTFSAKEPGIFEIRLFVSDYIDEITYTWLVIVNESVVFTDEDDKTDDISTTEKAEGSELKSNVALAGILFVIFTTFVSIGTAFYLRSRKNSPEGGGPK